MGFGTGQAKNLCRELKEARSRSVDDFRVLAALGIEHLGRGDSKRLLKHVALKDIVSLEASDITAISGFGDLTAQAITAAIPVVADDLKFLERNLTNIVVTPARSEAAADSPISGKHSGFSQQHDRSRRIPWGNQPEWREQKNGDSGGRRESGGLKAQQG
jgi:DNA ligase (NAD+)